MMKTKAFKNKNNVVIVGSLRCRIADFADDIVSKYHNTLLICLGNVGLGRGNRTFQNMEIEYLERICENNDNFVCFIRGNFDNPLFFDDLSRTKYFKGLNDYLKNIFFIEDYDIIETSKGNILCVGGGTDPNTPSDYVLLDPVSTVSNGAPNSNAWFKGQEVKKIDLEPSIEKVVKDDGSEEEIDHNFFNNWVKMSKISIIASNIPPMNVPTSSWNGDKDKSEDRISLFILLVHLKSLGSRIKTWYWCTDNYMPENTEIEGVTFKGITHYNHEEIA